MVRKLIFISVLIFIATFTLVFIQTKRDLKISEENLPQDLEYSSFEQQSEQWTRVEGDDYSFLFPNDWHWREYVDVDGVAVRFITNDATVERLGQELSENQIAMSFWTDQNEIAPEALETMTIEEINNRALDSQLQRAKEQFEIKNEEKLELGGVQAVTYLYEAEGMKYKKYFLVNDRRFAFSTAEFSDDNFQPIVQKIMETFELKKD